jgi:hypothetical protein
MLWQPVWTGMSANPQGTYLYAIKERTLDFVATDNVLAGVSNSTLYQMSTPFTNLVQSYGAVAAAVEGAVLYNAPVYWSSPAATARIDIIKASGVWPTSGNKSASLEGKLVIG